MSHENERYTVNGLKIMCGDRVVCSAVAIPGSYEKQEKEMAAIAKAASRAVWGFSSFNRAGRGHEL